MQSISLQQILEEAYSFLVDPSLTTKQFQYSLSNCHTLGVYSIWISDTLRSFVVLEKEGPVQWRTFDNLYPHKHNDNFLLHNHRYPLTSIPLSDKTKTEQYNVLYKPVKEINENTETYKKYSFYSSFFEEDRKAKYVFNENVLLERVSCTVNQPWFMETDEIHRVVWKGPIIALLKEHREPNFINKSSTDAYLVNFADDIPCSMHEGKLYQQISENEFTNITKILKQAILGKLDSLKEK